MVLIDGDLADVFVGAPVEEVMPLQVGGSTEVVMPMPKGVDGKLVRSSPRFGHGVNETFGHSR